MQIMILHFQYLHLVLLESLLKDMSVWKSPSKDSLFRNMSMVVCLVCVFNLFYIFFSRGQVLLDLWFHSIVDVE